MFLFVLRLLALGGLVLDQVDEYHWLFSLKARGQNFAWLCLSVVSVGNRP